MVEGKLIVIEQGEDVSETEADDIRNMLEKCNDA